MQRENQKAETDGSNFSAENAGMVYRVNLTCLCYSQVRERLKLADCHKIVTISRIKQAEINKLYEFEIVCI